MASMIVGDGEMDRYLPTVIEHALGYVDEVRVLDDRTTDGAAEWLAEQDRVHVKVNPGPAWREHEGKARQALLDWTWEAQPTHVLSLDADEFVPQGERLRLAIDSSGSNPWAWALRVCEVWELGPEQWKVRVDGGWAPTHAPVCWRAPRAHRRKVVPEWRIRDRQLACGREPVSVAALVGGALCNRLTLDLCHVGWADPATRRERYERYLELDGGMFHGSTHLASIMWEDGRVQLERYPKPAGIDP